jgi:hypothetical protein
LPQRNIENKINELKANGYVNKATYRCWMDITYPRIGRLYLLPKLRTLDQTMFDLIKEQDHCNKEIICPARHIISQCGSATERISQYVDHFLIPTVKTQSTYFRDNSNFIVKIEKKTLTSCWMHNGQLRCNIPVYKYTVQGSNHSCQ